MKINITEETNRAPIHTSIRNAVGSKATVSVCAPPHRMPYRKFLIGVSAIAVALSAQVASAQYAINVNSGTTGSYVPIQSYNETRAVDVTVLSPVNLTVTSLTLSGIGGIGDTATALIYNYNTEQLIASASGNVGSGGTVTVSISGTTLVSGDQYQIGFSGNLDDGTLFNPGSYQVLPNPDFPYTESTGSLKINGAYDGALNSFVTTANIYEPQLSLEVAPVPEPGSAAFLGAGLLSVLGFHRFLSKRAGSC